MENLKMKLESLEKQANELKKAAKAAKEFNHGDTYYHGRLWKKGFGCGVDEEIFRRENCSIDTERCYMYRAPFFRTREECENYWSVKDEIRLVQDEIKWLEEKARVEGKFRFDNLSDYKIKHVVLGGSLVCDQFLMMGGAIDHVANICRAWQMEEVSTVEEGEYDFFTDDYLLVKMLANRLMHCHIAYLTGDGQKEWADTYYIDIEHGTWGFRKAPEGYKGYILTLRERDY